LLQYITFSWLGFNFLDGPVKNKTNMSIFLAGLVEKLELFGLAQGVKGVASR